MATAAPLLPWASSGQAGVASGAAQSSQTFDAQAVQPSLPEEPPGMEEAVPPPPPPNPAPAQAPAQAPQAQQAQQAPDQAQQHAQAWAYWNAQQAYYQQYGSCTAPRFCSPLWPGLSGKRLTRGWVAGYPPWTGYSQLTWPAPAYGGCVNDCHLSAVVPRGRSGCLTSAQRNRYTQGAPAPANVPAAAPVAVSAGAVPKLPALWCGCGCRARS